MKSIINQLLNEINQLLNEINPLINIIPLCLGRPGRRGPGRRPGGRNRPNRRRPNRPRPALFNVYEEDEYEDYEDYEDEEEEEEVEEEKVKKKRNIQIHLKIQKKNFEETIFNFALSSKSIWVRDVHESN